MVTKVILFSMVTKIVSVAMVTKIIGASIPGATRFSEWQWVWNGVHSAS